MGPEGAGHFVKMVHNGIEDGDMQLCCEAYHLMKDGLGMKGDEMGDVSEAILTYQKEICIGKDWHIYQGCK